jgi:hypothetical protein
MSHPLIFYYGGIITSAETITNIVPVDFEPPPPLGGTTLWQNEGNGAFTEVSTQAGIDVAGNYRSADWVDFDNDGWLDLFLADKGNLEMGNGPNLLFRNHADGTFEEVASQVGLEGTTEGGTNVSAWADVDGDGFLDLMTQNGGFGGVWPFNEGPNQFFRNSGNTNHWLELQLVGTSSNRSGIGALVYLTAGGRTVLQAHSDGVDVYSQNAGPLHFGLGNNTVVDSIFIHWPSGIRQILTDVNVDEILVVVEEENARLVHLPIVIR